VCPADRERKVEDSPIYRYELDGEDETPLYGQLALIIKRCIRAGELRSGDVLPSESELCARYGIGRSTCRQAYGVLERDGFVYRRRGLGTFIANRKLRKSLSFLYSFTAQTLMEGMEPSSRILRCEVVKGDAALKSIFKTREEDFKAHRLYRLRKADGVPLVLEETYIPLRFCPVLNGDRMERESLYDILDTECGVIPHHGVESYEAVSMSEEQSALLECGAGTPAFAVERIGYLETDEVFEYTRSVVRGDRCKFEVPLVNTVEKPYRRMK
jgi:GntR family transcriptional regulator